MRRGSKPTKAKVEVERGVRRKSSKHAASRRRQLERRLAAVLEQPAAASDILKVISRSAFNLQHERIMRSPEFRGVHSSRITRQLRRSSH
jgi:tryptophan 2,3-dioxygenase